MNFLEQNLQLYCLPDLLSSLMGFNNSGMLDDVLNLRSSSTSSSIVEYEESDEDAGEDSAIDEEDEDDIIEDLENGGGKIFLSRGSTGEDITKPDILVIADDCSCTGKTASM